MTVSGDTSRRRSGCLHAAGPGASVRRAAPAAALAVAAAGRRCPGRRNSGRSRGSTWRRRRTARWRSATAASWSRTSRSRRRRCAAGVPALREVVADGHRLAELRIPVRGTPARRSGWARSAAARRRVALVGASPAPATRTARHRSASRSTRTACARVPDRGRRHPLRRRTGAAVPRAATTSTAAASAPSCRRCPQPAPRRWSRAGAIPAMPAGPARWAAFTGSRPRATRAAGQRRARPGRARRAERRRRRHRLGRGHGRRRARRVPRPPAASPPATRCAACASSRATAPAPEAFRGKNRVRKFQIAFGPAREQRFDVEIPVDPAADAAHWRDPFWVPLAQADAGVVRDGRRDGGGARQGRVAAQELRHRGDRRSGGVHRARQPRRPDKPRRRSRPTAPDCAARLPLLIGLGAAGVLPTAQAVLRRAGLRRASAWSRR